nr:MAG TPA: hypothetical protein [Caudoviricetes sp.]
MEKRWGWTGLQHQENFILIFRFQKKIFKKIKVAHNAHRKCDIV